MKTLLVTIAFGASVIAAPAMAQAPGGGGGFMQRDETRAEAQQRADMIFRALDTNFDGMVTRDEANQALAKIQASRGGESGGRGGRLQRMINDAFASGSSLTQQQMEAQALARFDAMDLNHDGTVTAAERQQARAQEAAPVAQPVPAPQAPPAKPQ
jgi:hypothetical protein